jgi:hypothetical protein
LGNSEDELLKKIVASTLSVLGALMVGFAADAASLQVDGTGLLTGATGVVVNGGTYSVTFVDGSCVSVFSGCDDAVDDFAFTTETLALSASQALLDSVFIGDFDDDPSRTFGCSLAFNCVAYTPFRIRPILDLFQVDVAFSGNGGLNLVTDSVGVDITNFTIEDTTTDPAFVWAVWSPESAQQVPEAPTFVLLGAGLLVLELTRRRHAQPTVGKQ